MNSNLIVRNIGSEFGENGRCNIHTVLFLCILHCASVEGKIVLYDDFPLQNGVSALMCASFWGHLQVVERILAAGAQPDLQNNVRVTSKCTKVQRPKLGILNLWQLSDNGVINFLYVEGKNKANE